MNFKHWKKNIYFWFKFRGNLIITGDASKISIPDSTKVQGKVILNNSKGGIIALGEDCHLMHGVIIMTYGGNIVVGNKCSINPYTILYGSGGLNIGNEVRIAAHCVIVTSSHIFSRTDMPIRLQGLTKFGVTIKDDVWIGANSTILDNVIISEHNIIAAGAVVNRSTQPGDIIGGVPGIILKNRLSINNNTENDNS
jgi:acetyltransferase-like isoleucine patch superfamily enzyme